MGTINFSDSQTKVTNLFLNGHRCSEAILKIYGPQFGLDENLSMKIGCALGGGIGSTENVCGAVNAAAIVLGLAFGRNDHEDQLSKNKTNEVIQLFVEKFLNLHHHVNCNDLKDSKKDICIQIVKDTSKILEEIILKERKH